MAIGKFWLFLLLWLSFMIGWLGDMAYCLHVHKPKLPEGALVIRAPEGKAINNSVPTVVLHPGQRMILFQSIDGDWYSIPLQ